MSQTATLATRPGVISGDALDPALASLGSAMIALSGIRSLVHTHSTRDELTINEDAVQYLLEERDNLVGAVDEALLAYANAVDPSGALAALVETAITPDPQPLAPPVAQLVRQCDGGLAGSDMAELRRLLGAT